MVYSIVVHLYNSCLLAVMRSWLDMVSLFMCCGRLYFLYIYAAAWLFSNYTVDSDWGRYCYDEISCVSVSY